MGNTACTHGMPSRGACVDCMFEQGLGAKVPAPHRGVYAKCVDLARAGVSDADIPARIIPELDDLQRREMVTVGLRVYASQARRSADAEARRAAMQANPTPRGKGKAAMAAAKRMARAAGLPPEAAERYLNRGYLAREVALGDGRRMARGEMTAADVESKVAQLTRQRDGVTAAITEFEQHLALLRATKARTLYEVEGRAAA